MSAFATAPPKSRSRIPSGPRPKPETRDSWKSIDSGLPYLDTQTPKQPPIEVPPSNLVDSPESDPDDIIAAYSRTESPDEEISHGLLTPLRTQRSMPAFRTTPLQERSRTVDDHTVPLWRDDPGSRTQAIPLRSEPSASFLASLGKPSTPRTKPTPARLNTSNLVANVSPVRALSPGLQHWQQVRQHVITTPADPTPKPARRLVAKAAGRLGFRQYSGNVLADDKRTSTMSSISLMNGTGELSVEEQEGIARERKRFAREIKACLDACAAEETKRRLQRSQDDIGRPAPVPRSNTISTYSTTGYAFDPGYSCFAPLLMELHRFMPDARAKRPWCRTCPHHATILAELGFAFLQDSVSTDGERQQALEVFGVIVRNWAPDNAEEQLDRWTWLIRALQTPDRQLRTRGLSLLSAFLSQDPSLPRGSEQPTSALAVQALAMELLSLVYAIETDGSGTDQHLDQVNASMMNLAEGRITSLDPDSLIKVLDAGVADELEGRTSGAEKEMIWMGVSKALGHDCQLARWLLNDTGARLKRFLPPPLLHATPPLILHLRARSTISMLSSFATVLRLDGSLSRDIWRVSHEIVFPVLEELPDTRGDTAKMMGIFLLQLELVHQSTVRRKVRLDDPFIDTEQGSREVPKTDHRDLLASYLKQEDGKEGIEDGAKELLEMTNVAGVVSLTRAYLGISSLLPLAQLAISILFDRCADKNLVGGEVEAFLLYLQQRHPRLFYKSLFSLSASVSPTSLAHHLRIVHTLSSIIGPDKYWLHADPPMVVIVLIGDTAPKPNKGKSKEGSTQMVSVRLGRYACLVELIEALVEPTMDSPKPKDKQLKTFVDAIENRIGSMLDAEEKDSAYPDLYRTLLCTLFYRIRAISQSVRRSPWHNMAISWFLNPSGDPRDQLVAELNGAYGSLNEKSSDTRQSGTAPLRQSTQMSITVKASKEILDTPFPEAVERLLVIIHAAFVASDWNALLPKLWAEFGLPGNDARSLSFLLMKCGEIIPDRLRDEVMVELSSGDTRTRLAALNKLVSLYLCRFDVLSQLVITDRRGPVFHFAQKTHEIVTTEIGSPHWLPPQEIHDAALRKFGTGLPLELRQRLMDLGWADDEDLAGKSDWDQVPITDLPTLHWQDVGITDGTSEAESSPLRALMRQASSTSGATLRSKKRKAVFAPVLVELIVELAALYAQETDVEISFASRGLVKLLQRDDPVRLLQPVTSRIADDFEEAMRYLDSLTVALTPGFAYTALNTLVGYLKAVTRSSTDFPHLAKALEIISHLVSGVSGISLRDVRKNKAEHILLPASIHEEEGGFKLHPPWQTGDVKVQTAQLLVLAKFLKANPRDVYMVKKMVSNLPTQGSIPHLPFARAWLLLIIVLFSTLNRNYNDRAELRHFLTNIGVILRYHGCRDMVVAAHAMRVFMLCSARFRRLFASMGISTVMGSVYDTYSKGREHEGIRDCIEYSMRSLYRIHQDHFVHQTCVVISEGEWKAEAVYGLLACLSTKSTASSAVASGLRGLNDKEELEALIQMLSRPELSLHEVGHAATERLAAKMASIDLDAKTFPKENIIRLFVTVIAANPASSKSINLIKLLAGITPCFEDLPSKDLLKDSIEALAGIVAKGRVGNDAARVALQPGTEDVAQDWLGARREYIHLVEAFTRSGGVLSAATTRRNLELAVDLIKQQAQHVGPAVALLVGHLAKTHLSSRTLRPLVFLRDMAPLYRMYIDVVDFSNLLDEITAFIQRSTLDEDVANVIVDSYTAPAVKLLAGAADDNMVFYLPLRSSTVSLLAAITAVRTDAFACVESQTANPSILAALVFPMCLRFSISQDGSNNALLDPLWLRVLNYVIDPFRRRKRTMRGSPPEQIAALSILSLQIIKIVIVRAPHTISSVQGLWTYLARHLTSMTEGGDARFIESSDANPFQATWTPPRVIDWMTWSLFQFISLLQNPLRVEFHGRIESALLELQEADARSGRLSPSPQRPGTLRFPSSAYTSHTPSAGTQSRPRRSSGISSLLVPSRTVSGARPNFQEISDRRTSRTTFEAFKQAPKPGYTKRFPTAASVRSVERSAGDHKREAIVHLLGTPSSPAGAFSPTRTVFDDPLLPAREMRVENEDLVNGARRAVRICQMLYRMETEDELDYQELPRSWTVNDAIDAITEETRIFIEEEFRNIFSPAQEEWTNVDREESRGYNVEQLESKYDVEEKVPILEISQSWT